MKELSEAELDTLIGQATVDCYNEDEELAGFAVMLEDNLALPFETAVLGVTVIVEEITETCGCCTWAGCWPSSQTTWTTRTPSRRCQPAWGI